MKFADYGQERERIATESEIEIFEHIKELADIELRLIRKSNDYVSVMCGDWDVARIKFTPRAKWIVFPVLCNEKNRIDSPSDVLEFADEIKQTIGHIEKWT